MVDLECTHATGLTLDGDRLLVTTESPGRLLDVGRSEGSVAVLYEATEGELREPLKLGDAIYFLANPAEPNVSGRLYRRASSGAVELIWSALTGSAYQLREGPDGSSHFVTVGADKGRGSRGARHTGPSLELDGDRERRRTAGDLRASGRPGRRLAWHRRARPRLPRLGRGLLRGARHQHRVRRRRQRALGGHRVDPGTTTPGVRVETRSGSTKRPDSSWSAWQDVSLDRGRGKVNAPSARFLQWRLHVSDPQTRLAAVSTTYLPAEPGSSRGRSARDRAGREARANLGSRPAFIAGPRTSRRRAGRVPGSRGHDGDNPADDPEVAWARRYRTVTWSAADPNDEIPCVSTSTCARQARPIGSRCRRTRRRRPGSGTARPYRTVGTHFA